MKNIFILTWTACLLMWTIANFCPTPPDSICVCAGFFNLSLTCNSTDTNETIFQSKETSLPRSYFGQTNAKWTIYLKLGCGNEEHLDDYFDVPIPMRIKDVVISRCSFTKKWATNFVNSSLESLEIRERNYLPTEENIALFSMLPRLRELRILKVEVLNLTSSMFKYLLHLEHLKIKNISNLEYLASLHPFFQIQNLKELDLSANRIKFLPDCIFKDLPYLEGLYLNENELETLPENLLVNNSNLRYLDLKYNKISQLPQNLLQNAKALTELYLDNNPLKQIPNDFLKNNIKLSIIDLHESHLTSIPQTLFGNMINLSELLLRGNKLNFIQNNYFRSNTLLFRIDLRSNEISQLIDSPFQYNTVLQHLHLNGNKLKNITMKDFSGLKSLGYLDISDNLISDIEELSFQKLINLEVLRAKQNRLKVLRAEYFKRNTLLIELDLSSNEISELLNSPFLFNTELEELHLNGNKLRYISRNDFSGLKLLKTLNLSKNVLSDIEEFSFEDMLFLEILDISQNFLKVIPHLHHPNITLSLSHFIANDNNITEFPNISEYRNLQELRLEGNQITSLSISNNFYPKTANTYIYLQNNRIETINVDSIKSVHSYHYDYDEMIHHTSLRKKVLFHLEGNRFMCDCHLHDFSEYISRKVFCIHHVLFSDAHKLTCEGPQNLKGQIMHRLPGDAFLCSVTERCPTGCRCTFRKSDSVVIMHCDGLKMNELPKIIPENIRILYMENNNLIDLNELKREEWQNLTELYLDGNQISSKISAHWYIPRHLRVLSLTRNNVNILPQPIKHHGEKMKNFILYLRNNSWKCDCSGAELRHWIHGHVEQVKDMNEILCMKDPRDGRSPIFEELMKLTHDSLCPFDHSPFIRQRVVAASIILLLGFICVVSMVFYHINKRKLLSYIYIHFPGFSEYLCNTDDLDSNKTFDAFISYSSDDRDVAIEISNELEKKEPYYRLCIHERDWMAGDYITENIVSSVKSSRKTILIISESFLESRWCDLEFGVAYNQTLKDKMSRFILIVKGDLPPKDTINNDLRFILATKTYITWGENHFWDKLRSALNCNFGERDILV